MATATLQSMRTELRARLGYAAVADTSGPMQDLLNSFLIGAHEQLSIQFEELNDRRDWLFNLQANHTMYPMPEDADRRTPDPARILGVYVDVSGSWSQLERGIDPTLYTTHPTGIPNRYDIAHGNSVDPDGVTIEVWPSPTDAYQLRIRGYQKQDTFEFDGDTPNIDSRLVMLLALANAKAHYGHPDARMYLDQLKLRLRKLRARIHNEKRYCVEPPRSVLPRPLIKGVDI